MNEYERPKIAVFRECRSVIEKMIMDGYKAPAILKWLEQEKGVSISISTWRSYTKREGVFAREILSGNKKAEKKPSGKKARGQSRTADQPAIDDAGNYAKKTTLGHQID